MRILTRTIWRAFPELDRFSDEQCERFVKAANARKVPKTITWCVVALVGVLVAAAAIIVPIWLRPDIRGNYTYGFPYWDDIYMHALLGKVWFWAWWMFAGGIAGFITRDVLLRLRVRRILRTRATCVQCRYSLLGLAVPASLIVQCPECGTPTHVDESMGELTVDEQGAARFTPKDVRKPPRIFTPSRMRIIKRVAIVTAIGLPVIVGGSFFGYEWFLRRQAAKALADRLTPEALMELMEQGQPADSDPRSVSVYDIVPRAEREKANADLLLEQNHPIEVIDGRKADWPDMTMIYAPYDPGYKPTEFDLATARRGRWQFELYQSSQLPAILDEMSATTNSRRSYNFLPQDPAYSILLPELGTMRKLGRYNDARMHVALQNRDMHEWLRAFESSLAMARASSSQPFLIHGLVAAAIESLAYRQVRALLATHPDASTLDAIEQAINKQPSGNARKWFEGDAQMQRDAIAWIFSDVKNVRFGLQSKKVTFDVGVNAEKLEKKWVGTYVQNITIVNARTDSAVAMFQLTPYERNRQPAKGPQHPRFLADVLGDTFKNPIRSVTLRDAERTATQTMMALERYYLAHGDYPQTLQQLVPDFLRELPLDPWAATPTPMGFRRIDPATDDEKRQYLLYTVGGDATDNGGFMKDGKRDYEALWTPKIQEPPVDFVFNDQNW
jgi:hypothetical protein